MDNLPEIVPMRQRRHEAIPVAKIKVMILATGMPSSST